MSDADEVRAGIAAGRLLVRRCVACGRAAYPPMPGCPHCGATDGEVVEAAGFGTLHTWTVCHVAFDPDLADDVPYVVGLVDLPEGARVVARLDIDTADLAADRRLRVAFPTGPDGTRRLRFVLDPPASEGPA